MKEILFSAAIMLSAQIFFSATADACIDSDCKPCPVGFFVTQKCCKEADNDDCVILSDKIEDCGKGKWREYPHYLPVATKDYCCTDAKENHCHTGGGQERYCGTGEDKEFPYSPVKKCCKDEKAEDCVVIRSKVYCGEYQLEDYPVWKADCCNSIFKKCTGHVKDCPRCL